jgi:amino acid transporter
MAGIAYILPISISIVVLLGIVYFSYRQTIEAYPQGGGSYTVASENLGVWAGLVAAASLMVDYVLTAAVGISAGVGALVSAVPSLQRHTLIHVSGNLDSSHAGKSARSAGDRRNISGANLPVHSLFAWNDRNRSLQGDRR